MHDIEREIHGKLEAHVVATGKNPKYLILSHTSMSDLARAAPWHLQFYTGANAYEFMGMTICIRQGGVPTPDYERYIDVA